MRLLTLVFLVICFAGCGDDYRPQSKFIIKHKGTNNMTYGYYSDEEPECQGIICKFKDINGKKVILSGVIEIRER